MKSLVAIALLAVALAPAAAFGEASSDRFSAGGYFRIMAQPDFEGGNGQLGYSDLYGRLLNEGPYAALELKLDVLQAPPGTTDVWAAIFPVGPDRAASRARTRTLLSDLARR